MLFGRFLRASIGLDPRFTELGGRRVGPAVVRSPGLFVRRRTLTDLRVRGGLGR